MPKQNEDLAEMMIDFSDANVRALLALLFPSLCLCSSCLSKAAAEKDIIADVQHATIKCDKQNSVFEVATICVAGDMAKVTEFVELAKAYFDTNCKNQGREGTIGEMKVM